jgi:S1-C subfamily serine protease
MDKIIANKLAVAAVGYYVPKKNPIWLGTGFVVGDGSAVMTCAHVVGDFDGINFKPYPRFKEIDGVKSELSCWLFRYKAPTFHNIRMPIVNMAIIDKLEIKASYFGKMPDVAYLKIDNSQWRQKFNDDPVPILQVESSIERRVGRTVAVLGYPSTNLLLTADLPKSFFCLEPLVQIGHIAGILPFAEFPLPHFIAIDTVIAKGSSGSPICDVESGKVIGMASNLLPFLLPNMDLQGVQTGYTSVPAAIGFGVPSNFFHGISLSDDGVGKFKFS